jgi:3-oxoacyl-[acyl-carrier protein] reductase
MRKLQGKVAIVTGASKGIGAGIAKGLGAAGAAVVVNDASSKAGADRVGAAITGKGGQALTDAFRDEASGTHVGTIGVTC